MNHQPHQSPDPLIDTLVAARYRIKLLLGEGGMGQVYLAEHEAIEKKMALKILRPEYSRKPDIVTRFQQEAISASRIKHPNVLDVFDFGQLDNGCFFLAMEFLDGNDLADELVRNHVIEALRGMRIAAQVCRALGAAHERGVVHRDLKPENVFLQRTADGDEVVKIVDFGIAQLRSNEEAAASQPKRRRLTRTGMIFGTPEYMAPEQAAGRKADHRVDVYALGVILYEMFTGAVPFTGETFMGVLAAHLNDSPPDMREIYPGVAISTQFQAVIMRTLAKDPDARFQSMTEFQSALAATPEGLQAGVTPPRGSVPDLGAGGHPAPPAVGAPPRRVTPAAPTAVLGAPDTADDRSAETVISPEEAHRLSRASTQLGAEAASQLPRKPHLGLLLAAVGVAAALAVAAVAGALLLLRARAAAPASAAGQTPSAAAASSAAPAAAAPAPPAPTGSAPPTTVTPTMRVRLDVNTVPPGAVLFKDGAQVCDRTPCEVMADPNETLELEARKGAAKGKIKVLAQREQKVTIKLAGAAAAPRPRPPPPKQPRLCERYDPNLGIKITAPCQ